MAYSAHPLNDNPIGVLFALCGCFVLIHGIYPLCVVGSFIGRYGTSHMVNLKSCWGKYGVHLCALHAGWILQAMQINRTTSPPRRSCLCCPGISGPVSSCAVLPCYPLTVKWPCRLVFCSLSHFYPLPYARIYPNS